MKKYRLAKVIRDVDFILWGVEERLVLWGWCPTPIWIMKYGPYFHKEDAEDDLAIAMKK